MSNWLVDKLIPSIMRSETQKSSVPEGLWHKCPSCEAVLYRPELEKTLDVCPKCQHHMRIDARTRLDIFLDADGREEIAAELEPVDRLKFRDSKKYKDRLSAAQKQTGRRTPDRHERQGPQRSGSGLRVRVFLYGRLHGCNRGRALRARR